jgi:hypothetical protein
MGVWSAMTGQRKRKGGGKAGLEDFPLHAVIADALP